MGVNAREKMWGLEVLARRVGGGHAEHRPHHKVGDGRVAIRVVSHYGEIEALEPTLRLLI